MYLKLRSDKNNKSELIVVFGVFLFSEFPMKLNSRQEMVGGICRNVIGCDGETDADDQTDLKNKVCIQTFFKESFTCWQVKNTKKRFFFVGYKKLQNCSAEAPAGERSLSPAHLSY